MLWRPKDTLSFPTVRLDGFRVLVRPPCREDWPQWFEVRSKNRAYLEPFEPAWPDNSLTEAFFYRRLEKQAKDWQQGRGYAFLVFKKDDSRLIGAVNLNNICRGAAQYCSVGYWLSEEDQGQGYMAEALRLVITYAFDELDLHRINAGCLLHNKRSKNMLLKLGFAEEGLAKKYVQIAGAWQDHALFGLNIEDWEERYIHRASQL